jgi:hypothetical protein
MRDKRPESVLVWRCELGVLACAHGVGSYKKDRLPVVQDFKVLDQEAP